MAIPLGCMLLSCHASVSESIYTLELAEWIYDTDAISEV